MPMPTPANGNDARIDQLHQNLHMVGPQAQLAPSHVHDTGIAGAKHANLPAFAQTDLLQPMSGVTVGLQLYNDTTIPGP